MNNKLIRMRGILGGILTELALGLHRVAALFEAKEMRMGGCGPYGCGDGTPPPWCCGGVPVRIEALYIKDGWVYVLYEPSRPEETREIESAEYSRKRQLDPKMFLLGWKLESRMFWGRNP